MHIILYERIVHTPCRTKGAFWVGCWDVRPGICFISCLWRCHAILEDVAVIAHVDAEQAASEDNDCLHFVARRPGVHRGKWGTNHGEAGRLPLHYMRVTEGWKQRLVWKPCISPSLRPVWQPTATVFSLSGGIERRSLTMWTPSWVHGTWAFEHAESGDYLLCVSYRIPVRLLTALTCFACIRATCK